jgi:uncharacterized protein with PIN domain
MKTAWFRFYEELNDFLPARRKKQSFSYSFSGNPSVKDIIESLGVPHAEIDMILVNSLPVGFSYKLNDADQVSVYPVFESLNISGITHLKARPLRIVKFIPDVHLGRLVKYLRLSGFDTYYDENLNDRQIIDISISEKRIILTRDRGLLKNKLVTHGYWVRSVDPKKQFKEIVIRFDLKKSIKPFTRCMECNTILRDISKNDISGMLMPKTRQFYEDFRQCPGCKRIYWAGSHYEKMKKQLADLID